MSTDLLACLSLWLYGCQLYMQWTPALYRRKRGRMMQQWLMSQHAFVACARPKHESGVLDDALAQV